MKTYASLVVVGLVIVGSLLDQVAAGDKCCEDKKPTVYQCNNAYQFGLINQANQNNQCGNNNQAAQLSQNGNGNKGGTSNLQKGGGGCGEPPPPPCADPCQAENNHKGMELCPKKGLGLGVLGL